MRNKTLRENKPHSGYIFVSDIHANSYTLKLIEMARKDYPDYTLVGGGDYIDGHKYAKEVLDFLMKQDNAVILRGNHEQMAIDYAEGRDEYITDYYNDIEPLWWSNGGKKTLKYLIGKYVSTKNEQKCQKLLKKSAYYKWFTNLPIMYDTPHIIFVHAGVHPDRFYNNPTHYPSRNDPKDDNYDMYRLWAREEYWWKAKTSISADDSILPAKMSQGHYGTFRHNLTGKTIVTGHTPTALISGFYDDWHFGDTDHYVISHAFNHCHVLKVQYKGEPARIFTDGGCHSKYSDNWGNVVVLDKYGNILRVYNYDNTPQDIRDEIKRKYKKAKKGQEAEKK